MDSAGHKFPNSPHFCSSSSISTNLKPVLLTSEVLKQSRYEREKSYFYLIFKILLFLLLLLPALGLCCCLQSFSTCGKQRLLSSAVHGLLVVVVFLVEEHGFSSCGIQAQLPATCGIFPDQTCVPCQIPIHWTTREVQELFLNNPFFFFFFIVRGASTYPIFTFSSLLFSEAL